MDQFESESLSVLCPEFAGGFVGLAPQGFKPAAKVVGGDEITKMIS